MLVILPGKTLLSIFLICLFILSFSYTFNGYFQKQQQQQTIIANAQKDIIFNGFQPIICKQVIKCTFGAV